MAKVTAHAIRGRLLSFVRAPRGASDAESYRYIDDGMVVVEDGRIARVGPAAELAAMLPAGTPVAHHADALIMPGFIDPHIHFPQTQVIASYGAQLLEWLEKYTFVEEQKFADPAHAARNAEFFLDELARNGTTTALAYCTAHPGSADALVCRGAPAQRRHDRRQRHHESQRPARFARARGHGHARQPRSDRGAGTAPGGSVMRSPRASPSPRPTSSSPRWVRCSRSFRPS